MDTANSSTTEAAATKRGYFWLMSFLNLLGIGISLLSLVQHTASKLGLQQGPSFCNISATVNCDAVNASPWSYLFGFPIASYGLAFYLLCFLLCAVALEKRCLNRQAVSNLLLFLFCLAALLSIYLFLISEFVIGALCLLCIGMYLINFLNLGLAYFSAINAPILARLKQGANSLLCSPLVVLGLRNVLIAKDRTQARILAVLIILLGLLAFLFPRIYGYAVIHVGEALDIKKMMALIVNDWEKQPIVSIENKFESGWDQDYSKGPVFAPVQIVEFSDFECPFCRKFYVDVEVLSQEFAGKLHVVHRNFPIDNSCNPKIDHVAHRNACFAAIYSRCAGEQGKFWQVADQIFRMPEFDNSSTTEQVRAAIHSIGVDFNLDQVALDECIKSGRQKEKIISDIEEADRLGLTSTPSVWVNGKRVRVVNIEILREILNRLVRP